MLFDKLTVKEHIEFFASVKGQVLDKSFEQRSKDLLDQLDLYDKRDDLAANLSGGQKRKLSTIIALLGVKTKLVFLDEPSSGMDPWVGYYNLFSVLFHFCYLRNIEPSKTFCIKILYSLGKTLVVE